MFFLCLHEDERVKATGCHQRKWRASERWNSDLDLVKYTTDEHDRIMSPTCTLSDTLVPLIPIKMKLLEAIIDLKEKPPGQQLKI